jgi:hypothetical protein
MTCYRRPVQLLSEVAAGRGSAENTTEENVHAVIAVGHPAVTYQRLTGRKKAVSRFVEP